MAIAHDFVGGATELLKAMRRAGIPITRETFINANWDGDPPRPWDYDAEMELPPELRQELPEPEANPIAGDDEGYVRGPRKPA